MNCTLCNNQLVDSVQFEIYFTFTTHSNTLLANYMKKILNCDLKESHSKYICQECHYILEKLDFAELAYSRLRKQIFDRWFSKESESLTKDACNQTEDEYLDNKVELNSKFLTLETVKEELEDSLDEDYKPRIKLNNNNKKGKLFICEICQKRFKSKNGMVSHRQRQHPSPPELKDSLDLVECDVVISESQQDNEDLEDNDDTEDNPQPTCKKKTKQKHVPGGVRPLKYACPQCPKMWRTSGELRTHIASHSNLRPYICEVCGQAYKHKAALDIHVGMHNGVNPFSCHFCKKAFTQKGALQRHLPIHTGETPYQCDLCGKRFVHHTSFNMHTLAHSGQKAFKCKICGLALLSSSHLKRHVRGVHTGERPYECSHCGKRFAERYNLAAHQRLHEAGPSELVKRMHKCPVCGTGFERRQKLEEHLLTDHHKIAENDQSRNWVGHLLAKT